MLDQWDPIITNWPHPVLLVNDSGHLAACSNAFIEWSGWSSSELASDSLHIHLCSPSRNHKHTPQQCLFHSPISNLGNHSETAQLVHRQGHYLDVRLEVSCITIEQQLFRLIQVWPMSDIGYGYSNDYTSHEKHGASMFLEHSCEPFAEFSEAGQLLYANPKMISMINTFGHTAEGDIACLPAGIESLVQQTLSTQSTLSGLEHELSDGSVWSWSLYPHGDKGTGYVQGIGVDITDRVRRQQIETDMASIVQGINEDIFTKKMARLAYALNEPMSDISRFTNHLKTLFADDNRSSAGQYVQIIENALARLDSLVVEHLQPSGREQSRAPLDLSHFSARALCDELTVRVLPMADRKGLKLSYECFDRELHTDRSKLSTMLVLLLDNAIRHTHEGQITLVTRQLQDAYELSVIDTGIGMSEVGRQRFVEALNRSDENGSMPLENGLVVVKNLARDLQATLSLESACGRGTRFFVRLPLSGN